jgi:beta-galactosidase
MKKLLLISAILFSTLLSLQASEHTRERLLMDFNWKFAYGHPYDAAQDYNHGTSYFSYYAKAGYGDGPAAANFDDRAWRVLDLPHDFAVEQPFDAAGSHSHGYKAIGRNFPGVSVGWYRKSFVIPQQDLGRRITVTFDGAHRDSRVWVNGHFLGNEASGYNSFTYDITEYLNYGGQNVLAVRVDVTYEEGWYYEGAGIYRHVWLNKTSPLHVALYGTFVYSEVVGDKAIVSIETEIQNDALAPTAFTVQHHLLDANGKVVAESMVEEGWAGILGKTKAKQQIELKQPRLWSLDDPYLYKVKTTVSNTQGITDVYYTTTGIRTIKWDSQKGFILNGEAVKLKGTNNHQDHAGVGTAMPDELQYFRLLKLKEMGSNAYRTSHNPPTPELLEACDRLGILVINENRLMATAPFQLDYLERLIKRDRNHPSIILWSLGNEEWAIEGGVVGERIIQHMQALAKQLDPTRPKNAASSGGWGNGVSKHIEVMGFNYLGNGDHDAYHAKFPDKPTVGTEEGSTNTTRGVYFDDPVKQHIAAYDRDTPNGHFKSIEHTWKFYDSREWLAGMFIWTGFDYRGEPTPYAWPSIHSYFGMYDVCGFPKDIIGYLKSWWGNEPVLHLFPHWNWEGKEGEPIKVVAYSNCDEVELFVNKKSAGRKKMERNGHIEWTVPYKAGSIKAVGYTNGKKQLEQTHETTGEPVQLVLEPHKTTVNADGEDLAIFTVSAIDGKGRFVPTADNHVSFDIEGPGKIIGVGNGDNTCLEADKYIEQVSAIGFDNMKAKVVEGIENRPETAVGYNDNDWPVHRTIRNEIQNGAATVYRSVLMLPNDLTGGKVTLFFNAIGNQQVVYVNGKAVSEILDKKAGERYRFELDASTINPGKNELAIVATPYTVRNTWESPNTYPGVVQVILPAKTYNRSLFNGYAQVLVQSTKLPGEIKLIAKSAGLKNAGFVVKSNKIILRPAVD